MIKDMSKNKEVFQYDYSEIEITDTKEGKLIFSYDLLGYCLQNGLNITKFKKDTRGTNRCFGVVCPDDVDRFMELKEQCFNDVEYQKYINASKQTRNIIKTAKELAKEER